MSDVQVWLEPHIAKVAARNVRGATVDRDMGQDQVFVLQEITLPNGKRETRNRRVGYILRKPGATFNAIVPDISESQMRALKLLFAERDEELARGGR